jgi:hypothetical protein
MNAQQRQPVPLPNTVTELESRRIISTGPNLNTDMDRVVRALWENPDFRKWLNACWDSEALEGAKVADDFMATEMIREYCQRKDFPELHYIGRKNLWTIRQSMNVVLRRFGMSRKQRAQTVAGEIVPNDEE